MTIQLTCPLCAESGLALNDLRRHLCPRAHWRPLSPAKIKTALELAKRLDSEVRRLKMREQIDRETRLERKEMQTA